MATKLYSTRIAIELAPTDGTSPDIVVSVDGDIIHSGELEAPATFTATYQLGTGAHQLTVDHRNKSDNDPLTSVTIKSITFNGISRTKFVWLGVYHPDYPEPWATEMRQSGYSLDSTLTSIDHLGWNGIWTLEFTVPVFTWIHRVEDMGWIYY